MNIVIKTPEMIERMRVASQGAASTLSMIAPHVKVGVTTEELNTLCHEYITQTLGATPAPLNYRGFPKSICTSINHQVCHGIPGPKKLKAGDIINIDVTIIKEGMHGDTSKMFILPGANRLSERLCQVSQQCLYLGIQQVKPGATLGDIARVIEEYAHEHDYTSVRDFCGHGIGETFHEDPQVLHYINAPNADVILKPGMVFTIEPMINAGKHHTKILNDGWTAVTKDRSLSAQWEHTIAVTETGFEILTLREEEREQGITETMIPTH